jgi:hypothetical protein
METVHGPRSTEIMNYESTQKRKAKNKTLDDLQYPENGPQVAVNKPGISG